MADQQRDVIEILTHDHREVEQMFSEFEATTGPEKQKDLANNIVIELVRHSVAEEEHLYPTSKKVIAGGEELVQRELKEHQEAEQTMDKLEDLGPDDPEFVSLMHHLMSEIRQHVQEEEGELFPQLRQAVSQDELLALGAKVESAKKTAPTRPHPMSPNHPPFNKMAAPGAGLVDRIRDFVTGRGK